MRKRKLRKRAVRLERLSDEQLGELARRKRCAIARKRQRAELVREVRTGRPPRDRSVGGIGPTPICM
jgi:hypothetical protein